LSEGSSEETFLTFNRNIESNILALGLFGPKNEIFRCAFWLDTNYIGYERRVYNLNNLLGDIGGFYNSIFFMGKLVFSFFQFGVLY
jgi:hypothetical protein